jgi:hypothetical protein
MPSSVIEGRQAVLFLKKKKQKNFCPFTGERLGGLRPISVFEARFRMDRFALFVMTGVESDERQTDKSFFASFFSKKEDPYFLERLA